MSNFTKNMSAAQTAPRHGLQNVRTLVSCALLAAVSVVLARFIIPMPNETTRFSIEAVPIFLAGMLFGPMAGGLVGFSATRRAIIRAANTSILVSFSSRAASRQ